MPVKRQDRQVHDEDDACPKHGRPSHLAGPRVALGEPFPSGQGSAEFVLVSAQTSEDVLHHHDCRVHGDAEIDRPEAEQIGADMSLDHAARRHQHRQRDHERHNECGDPVSEEPEQHGHHEQRAFEQVLSDGLDRGIDEVRTIIDGPCRNACRQ